MRKRLHAVTPDGVYAWLRMPSGPAPAPAIMQAYMADMQTWEKRIKEAKTDTSSVRAGDAPYFDRLIHDTRKKAAEKGYRPAKEGEDQYDPVLGRVISTIGTPFIATCKRQILDGGSHLGWVLEWWYYNPDGEVYHIDAVFTRQLPRGWR